MYFFDFVFLKCSYGFLSMIFGFLGKFIIYIGKISFKKSRKHMSKMSIFFSRLKKKHRNFFLWKSKWKMKISQKNTKDFPIKKVWVCLWGIRTLLKVHLFFEVPYDFWEVSVFVMKGARYPRFYPIPSCGVCGHLCRCLPLVWTRPLGYKNLYSNRVYFAVFEDALEYKIIVDYWVLKNFLDTKS